MIINKNHLFFIKKILILLFYQKNMIIEDIFLNIIKFFDENDILYLCKNYYNYEDYLIYKCDICNLHRCYLCNSFTQNHYFSAIDSNYSLCLDGDKYCKKCYFDYKKNI